MIKNKQSILVVDDTEANIDVLLGILDEFDVAVATSGASALEIVREDSIDLILLDIMMPEMDGYEVFQKLQENEDTKEIPVIFITALADEESIEKGYELGAVDFVTKPFKPKELAAKIKRELKLKSLIDHLEFIASHDVMTGIYNRRRFFELAERLFAKSDDIFAVMIDIDKFKAINDTYGHPLGDKVIISVTDTISSFLKDDTIFGRLGGEEFAIVCNRHDMAKVEINIEKMRKAIENIDIVTDNGDIVKFTISAGIVHKSPNTKNLDYLLKEADDVLYEAKNSGRNKTIFRV